MRRASLRMDEGRAVNPGLFRHQITWQRKNVTGQNSFGEDIYEWVQFAQVKCQVKEIQGREVQAQGQRWAEARYEIVQHYIYGLAEKMRGSWYVDGVVRYLDIIAVSDSVQTGHFQTVYAKEWIA